MTAQEAVAPERRQRRWHQVHDRLYEAACELFLEKGYAATSVDEIAERADVARKTAFNHFPRKRDFINEWGSRRRRQVLAALSPVLMADPRLEVVLRHYFAELADINLQQRSLTICMSKGWRESGGPFDTDPHELVDVLRGFIGDAVARGEIPAAVNASHMGTVLYSSYFGLLYDWCEGPEDVPPFDLNEAFTQLLDVFLAGINSL
ncbi:TetR/AcrR family transcriptional regulator [Thermopolyspora sp. NPDC052614]|uniref:TetR/AcrR family transcriptional regulator n=1 Tax=Thermopolyspora sp. NPDC052614 TaxID=3155682 RepID=UPI0034171BBE